MDMTLVVSGDDAVMNNGIDAFCAYHGWNDQMGVTKLDFIKDKIILFLRDGVIAYNAQQAALQAQVNSNTATAAALDTLVSTLTQV